MNNYAERRGTTVVFLSTRDEGTEAARAKLAGDESEVPRATIS